MQLIIFTRCWSVYIKASSTWYNTFAWYMILKAFSCIQNLLCTSKAKGTPSSSTFFKLNSPNMPQNGHPGPLRAQGRSSSKPRVSKLERLEANTEFWMQKNPTTGLTFKWHLKQIPKASLFLSKRICVSTKNGPGVTSADEEGGSEQWGRVTEGWELPTQNISTVMPHPVKHS